MAIAETVSYAMVFAITIILSIITIARLIENGRRLILDWMLPIIEAFSFVCWLVLVPLHMAFVAGESAFLEAPAILYFAFAVLFLIFAIKSVADNLALSAEVRSAVDSV